MNITAAFQRHTHRAADFAPRHVRSASPARGVASATARPRSCPSASTGYAGKPLTAQQQAENRGRALGVKLHYDNVRRSLSHGYYQGWDLNPAQLPIRYAAVYQFFLEPRGRLERPNKFIDSAAKATLIGSTFDDAATAEASSTLPARHRLRRDHRGRGARHGHHPRRAARPLVREDRRQPHQGLSERRIA
ncbi:MAG: hypothetical protein IPK07_35580 [Deltaproteobacteria bacterium]|nr:hypothetical protein [Deltaproteobacteria bacterium]